MVTQTIFYKGFQDIRFQFLSIFEQLAEKQYVYLVRKVTFPDSVLLVAAPAEPPGNITLVLLDTNDYFPKK